MCMHACIQLQNVIMCAAEDVGCPCSHTGIITHSMNAEHSGGDPECVCMCIAKPQPTASISSKSYKTAACMMPNSPLHSNLAGSFNRTTQHIENACRFRMPFAKEMAVLSIYIASSLLARALEECFIITVRIRNHCYVATRS